MRNGPKIKMKKVTELDLLKVWIDSKFTVLHVMLAIIMIQVTEGWLPTVLFSLYMLHRIIYWAIRITFIEANSKDYRKIPPK